MTDDIPFLFFAQSEHKSGRYGKIDMNYIINLSHSIPLVNEFFMYLGTYIVHFEPYFILQPEWIKYYHISQKFSILCKFRNQPLLFLFPKLLSRSQRSFENSRLSDYVDYIRQVVWLSFWNHECICERQVVWLSFLNHEYICDPQKMNGCSREIQIAHNQLQTIEGFTVGAPQHTGRSRQH